MYIPGRNLMCSRQSKLLMSASVYPAAICFTFLKCPPAERKRREKATGVSPGRFSKGRFAKTG
jgi:hypothetical protein